MLIYYNEASAPLYGVIYSRGTAGQVWDTVAGAMAAYSAGSHANYAILLTYVAGDRFTFTPPASLPTGDYDVLIYYRVGGSPAVDDTHVDTQRLNNGASTETDDSSGGGVAGLTTLRAVNEMLGAIGESPVVQLDSGGSSEVADAERILGEVNEEVQTGQRWNFNTEVIELARDSDNKIPLSANYLRVDPVNPAIDAIRRGAFLYDKSNNTYIFDSSLDCDVTRLIPFEDCPPSFKKFVTVVAKVRFQKEIQGSRTQDALLTPDYYAARRAALDDDANDDDGNMLNHSTAREVLGRSWFTR
jgi:hypothetical protein